MFRTSIFMLRIAAAWAVVVFAIGVLYSELPLIGEFSWPVLLLVMTAMPLVVTGVSSHVQRVRLVAGRVDRESLSNRHRRQVDLALFNLATDSKLRDCDLVSLRVRDLSTGGAMARRAVVLQRKNGRPVQFEISDLTRAAVADWIRVGALGLAAYLFQAEAALQHTSPPGSTPGSSRHGS